MTTPSTSEAVELEVRIAARPETVFSLLNNGEGFSRWMGRSADLDPRKGGALRVDINGRDIARGEVVEIVPNRKVVFTWGWEGEGHPIPPGSSTVEISLSADGDGTILRLRHSGLPADQAAGHKDGWEHFLPRLITVAEGGDPGPDPWSA